jgi:HK97 family phage portal protein
MSTRTGRLMHRLKLAAAVLRGRFKANITSRELAELLAHGHETDSGAYVTPDSAMRVATVYACKRVLAETLASVPLILYRRDPARGRVRVPEHQVAALVRIEPNGWQTSMEWREMLQGHLCLQGNAYCIKTVVRGEVRELLPVVPDRVTPQQDPVNKRIAYEVRWPDGTLLTVPAERMLHLRGLSSDGVVGLSPVQVQRETIGLAMQLVKHGAGLFKRGALIRGVVSVAGLFSDDAYKRLKDSFEAEYAGADNAGKTIILEEGAKFEKAGMSSEEAQFLESRKFSRSEIAAIFRVPPHLIGDLERSTFSNIEHQSLEFVKYTMLPWFVRWEQRLARSLLSDADRRDHYFEFLVDGLLRGDSQSRASYLRTMVMTGVMTRNEGRERENLERGPDQLDEFITPLNVREGAAAPGADASPRPEDLAA